MNPFLPPLLVVFFSIFHFLGGVSLGQGLRLLRQGEDAMFYLLFGAGMGGVPVIFDWVFLIAPGYTIQGLIGPVVFLVAAFVGAFLESNSDGPAVISAGLGTGAFLIGLFSIPLMLNAAQGFNPATEDYIFGACFVLLFVVIGGSFAWKGFSAILRGISLDDEQLQHERRLRRPRKRKTSMGISVKKYWE